MEKSIRDERRVAQAFQAAAELDLKHFAEDQQNAVKPLIAHASVSTTTNNNVVSDVNDVAPVVTAAEEASLNDFLGNKEVFRFRSDIVIF